LPKFFLSAFPQPQSYYSLTFDSNPAKHPDEYHDLQVKVENPGLAARTRTGYYAQPAGQKEVLASGSGKN
jgi:hypothetical protein